MADKKEVKTVEQVIAEFEAKLIEKDNIIAERDKTLEEANKAIVELTGQLNQKKDVQQGGTTVEIKGKKYPLLLAEVNHKNRILKYEDFVSDEKLAIEVLEMDADVFGPALK